MEGGGLCADDWAFWDLHYGEIVLICLLLDLYLLGDRLGHHRLNWSSIGRSLWRSDWCCFPRSMGSPLVQEIWSSIARELFLSLSIGRLIGRSWAWSGDLEFSSDIDRETARATGSLIGRPRRRWVWFSWHCVGFVFWGLYRSRDSSGDQDIYREIEKLINRGFSGISTCWDIAWELNWKIVLVTGLVLVASPSRYNRGIVEIQIDTTVEYSSPSY